MWLILWWEIMVVWGRKILFWRNGKGIGDLDF